MKLTEEQFCKMIQAYDGEPINKISQVSVMRFNGKDLKEFIEHCIDCYERQKENLNSMGQGFKRILKIYGEMKATDSNGNTVTHVWDYANHKARTALGMRRAIY